MMRAVMWLATAVAGCTHDFRSFDFDGVVDAQAPSTATEDGGLPSNDEDGDDDDPTTASTTDGGDRVNVVIVDAGDEADLDAG